VEIGQGDVVDPFRPLPREAKVAEVMGKPVDEAANQLHVEARRVLVDVPDCPAQAGCYRRGRNLAGFGQDRVVVDQLVLRVGQLEQLRKDGVDGHILGLPRGLARLAVFQPIKGSGALNKRVARKIAVDVDEQPRRHVAVEVENVDSIKQCVSNQRRSDAGYRRHRLDVLAGIDGEVDLGEQGTRPGEDFLGNLDGRKSVLGRVVQLGLLLYVLKRHLPRPRQTRDPPRVSRLGLQLLLEQADEALGRGWGLLLNLGKVGVDQRLQRMCF